MRSLRSTLTVSLGALCAALLAAGSARAGLPECGNLRLEEVKRCEIRANVSCMAGCKQLGVYKTACATRLQTVCRRECMLPEQPSCTSPCTEQCAGDCSRGVNVICSHNCFKECAGSCELRCGGAANVEQCRATCEATCDGECDIKCKPLVEASCYQHCVECCGGACKAQANLSCQTTCQDRSFEQCEHEFRAECEASCSADGALFCDGRYVLSGADVPRCAQALLDRGISANFNAQGSVNIEIGGAGGGVGCAMARGHGRDGGPTLALGLLVALMALVHRRR